MLTGTCRYVERLKIRKKCEFFDDCTKAHTVKSHYVLQKDLLKTFELKNDRFCVEKRNKRQSTLVPVVPQPSEENIVTISRY